MLWMLNMRHAQRYRARARASASASSAKVEWGIDHAYKRVCGHCGLLKGLKLMLLMMKMVLLLLLLSESTVKRGSQPAHVFCRCVVDLQYSSLL